MSTLLAFGGQLDLISVNGMGSTSLSMDYRKSVPHTACTETIRSDRQKELTRRAAISKITFTEGLDVPLGVPLSLRRTNHSENLFLDGRLPVENRPLARMDAAEILTCLIDPGEGQVGRVRSQKLDDRSPVLLDFVSQRFPFDTQLIVLTQQRFDDGL